MSWDIVLFSSAQKIKSIADLDENQLQPTNFCGVLESSFERIIKNDNHREIVGTDFTIDFFTDSEPASNFMLSLQGENGLYELIELAKKHNWQIYDSGMDEMIDLDNPEKNGYKNHRKYVDQILKRN